MRDALNELRAKHVIWDDGAIISRLLDAANSIPEGPQRHELKVWPEYYAAIDAGKKTLELRKDDRGFQVGDSLLLREFDPKTGIYGESCERVVTHIVQGGHFGIADGYVAMSISEAIVPEGAPVGTIARRPDGEWIAWRTEDGWGYRFIGDEEPNEWPPGSSIADFWPVIYDPTDRPPREELREYFHKDLAEHCQADDPDEYPDEYHEGDKPRLERLMREPSVFDADPHGTVNLDGTLPTFTPDPTAQQEPALRERFPEQASAYVADPELAGVDDEPLPSGSLITPKPRVLPSLDCEEARDGTAWQAAFSNTVHRRGWKFWYVPAEREWHTDGGYDGSGPLNTLDFLTKRGPYTEVLGDPS